MVAHGASKRRKWPWVLGGVALLVVIIAASSGGDRTNAPVSPPASASAAPNAAQTTSNAADANQGSTYTYKITGRGQASLTYTGQGGNIAQSTGHLPWSKTVNRDVFSYGSVTASVMGSSGPLSCSITDETGRVVAENSSEGGSYASVTCSTV